MQCVERKREKNGQGERRVSRADEKFRNCFLRLTGIEFIGWDAKGGGTVTTGLSVVVASVVIAGTGEVVGGALAIVAGGSRRGLSL